MRTLECEPRVPLLFTTAARQANKPTSAEDALQSLLHSCDGAQQLFPGVCGYSTESDKTGGKSALYFSVISQRRMAEKNVDRAFFIGRAAATAAFELLY